MSVKNSMIATWKSLFCVLPEKTLAQVLGRPALCKILIWLLFWVHISKCHILPGELRYLKLWHTWSCPSLSYTLLDYRNLISSLCCSFPEHNHCGEDSSRPPEPDAWLECIFRSIPQHGVCEAPGVQGHLHCSLQVELLLGAKQSNVWAWWWFQLVKLL